MKSSSDSSVPHEAIEAAAAVWLSLRDRGMTPEETSAFLKWLEQDARNVQAFAELDATWKLFDRLSSAAPAAKVPGAKASARPRSTARRRVLRAAFIALGSAAVFMLGLFVAFSLRAPKHTAETELGALRKIELPDGSVAQLNTDSALDVSFTATERRVRIVRGEVFFSVQKEPNRPFLVALGPVVVRAVGTAFNVRQRESAIEVLVTEGRVTVTDASPGRPPTSGLAPIVSAGQRARVEVAGANEPAGSLAPKIEALPAAEVQRALAWQERRLEFEEAELGEVVREFNRYDQRKLEIADAALARRRFTGSFRFDARDSFLRLLETNFGVVVENRGERILLRTDVRSSSRKTP